MTRRALTSRSRLDKLTEFLGLVAEWSRYVAERNCHVDAMRRAGFELGLDGRDLCGTAQSLDSCSGRLRV
jgi:hypothetical protein